MADKAGRKRGKVIDPSAVDWANMERLADLGRVFERIDSIDTPGHKAQAGLKAARVQQLPIDTYAPRHDDDDSILNGIQYDAAKRLYGAFVRSQSPGGPCYDGTFVQGSSSEPVSQRMIEAFDEVTGALNSIRDGEHRVIVDWIVIGRSPHGPNSIRQVSDRFSVSHEACKNMLRAGLDDIARDFYRTLK